MVVVAGYELVEWHPAARLGLEEVHKLAGELGKLAGKGGHGTCNQAILDNWWFGG